MLEFTKLKKNKLCKRAKLALLITVGTVFQGLQAAAVGEAEPRTPERKLCRDLTALDLAATEAAPDSAVALLSSKTQRPSPAIGMSGVGDGGMGWSGAATAGAGIACTAAKFSSPVRKRDFTDLLAADDGSGEFISPSRKLARQSAELLEQENGRVLASAVVEVSPARRPYSADYKTAAEALLAGAQALINSSERHQKGTPLRRIRATAAQVAASAAGLPVATAVDPEGYFKPVLDPKDLTRATRVLKDDEGRRDLFNQAHSLVAPDGAVVTMRPGEYPRLMNVEHVIERHAGEQHQSVTATEVKKAGTKKTKEKQKFATAFTCDVTDIPKLLSTAPEVASRVDAISGAKKKTLRLPDGSLGVAVSYDEPLHATFYPLTRATETTLTPLDLERNTVRTIGVDAQDKPIRVNSVKLLEMARTAITRRHGAHGSKLKQDPIIGVAKNRATVDPEILVDIHGELEFDKKLTKVDRLVFSGESQIVRVPASYLGLAPEFVASLNQRKAD